jgi:ATP-binding protein involved in chromosome partitioning
MSLDKQQALDALRTIQDATSTENLVSLGHVRALAACDGYISVTIAAPVDDEIRTHLKGIVHATLAEASAKADPAAGEAALKQLNVEFVTPDTPGDGIGRDERIIEQPRTVSLKQASSSDTVEKGSASAGKSSVVPGARTVIAVGAGKGGVGKSTVAVNLAVGLARKGFDVGVLDADIYGPSLPTLLGLESLDVALHKNRLQTFHVHGVRAMTIGKLVDPEKPLIWRGPMAHGAFKQLAEQTDWGKLDYLIVDLPPGTGDVPLTMSQLLSLTGAIVVCTPQRVAQDDAVRAVRMFQQLKIDVLGIVENMSFFIGDDGKEYDIFGRGGAEMMAQRLGLPFLGSLPLNMPLRAHSDAGQPLANFDPEQTGELLVRHLTSMIDQAEAQANLAGNRVSTARPTLTVS